MDWKIDFGRFVIRNILDSIMIRRTQSSSLELPDGTTSFVGASVPPARISLQEVKHSKTNDATV